MKRFFGFALAALLALAPASAQSPQIRQLLLGPQQQAASAGTPVSLTWVSSGADAAGGSTVTYSGLSLGSAVAGRIIAVAVAARPTGAVGDTISSMTIGGISATQVSGAYANDTTNAFISDIWQATVPTGTSGNVVITYAATTSRSAVFLYRIITTTPTASSATSGFTDTPIAPGSQSTTITVPTNGAALSIFGNRAASSGVIPIVWTNATFDNNILNVGGVNTAIGSANTTTVGTSTISAQVTGNTNVSPVVMSTAAWGP